MQGHIETTSSASETLKGAVLMMTAMAGLVINDGFMRFVLLDLPLFQSIFLRGVILTGFLLMLALARDAFAQPLARRDKKLIAARSGLEAIATLFFLTALSLIPFANLSAILQALPLSVTLAAAVFLGAPIGWRRIAAIIVGFCGVLVIVRPTADGFELGSLCALAVVALITIRELASRQLSPGVPSVRVALLTAIVMTATGGFGCLMSDWLPMTWRHIWLMVGSASFLMVGYVAGVAAMRHGDIAAVSPFRYTSLVWAIAIGLIFFREVPDTLTLLGAFIIVGTGIFTIYRERRLANTTAPDNEHQH